MARHKGTGIKVTEGHIYVLQCPDLPKDVFKIGMTTKDPYQRAKEIQSQFEVPKPFQILRTIPTDNVYRLESRVHRILDNCRVRENDEILELYNLRACTEMFRGLSLLDIDHAISGAQEDMNVEDTWCRNLQKYPEAISEIQGVGATLSPKDPNISEWIRRLGINGNRPVAEFTLRQIANGAPNNAGKTTYLYWKVENRPRIWFDPTQPKNASTFIHRRFETANSTDTEIWQDKLGEDAIWYEYRKQTELRMVLWKQKHFDEVQDVLDYIVPSSNFLF